MAAVFCAVSILMFFFIIYRTRHIDSPVVEAEVAVAD